MKKKIIILISLIVFFIFLNFLSDFVIVKVQNILERKILTVLPEGSYIKELKIEGLTGISADSLYIKDICLLPGINISYSPLGLMRRRVKKITLSSPSVVIPEQEGSNKGVGGEISISTLFYVEEFEISKGHIEYKGHECLVSGTGKVFSTSSGEIILDVPKLWGKIDSIPFSIEKINISVAGRISNINVKEVKMGDSKLEISSEGDGAIMGEGRIHMTDLNRMFGIDGKGFIDIFFVYDSTLTYKGESKVLSIKDFNLPLFTFSGKGDSVNVKGEKLFGFVNFGKAIYGQIELFDFDFRQINAEYPSSKVSGLIGFSYVNKDTIHIASDLQGELLECPLEDFDLDLTLRGKEIFVDSCECYFNKGEISFSGVYGERIDGNLQVKNLDVSPLTTFLGIEVSSVLDLGLSLHDKVYGAFSLGDFTYKGVDFKSIEGNVNLSQGKGTFPGVISFVSKDISFKKRKVFEFGKSSLEIQDGKLDIKSIFKSKNRNVEGHLSLSADTVKVESLSFEYSGGWLSLNSPFSFTYKHDFSIKDIRFKGNKGEDFRINNFSLSASGIKGDLDLMGFRPEILSEFGLLTHSFSGNIASKVYVSGEPGSPILDFRGGGKIKTGEISIGDSLNFDIRFKDNIFSISNLSVIEEKNISTFKGKINPENRSINLAVRLYEAGKWIFYPVIEYLTAEAASVTGKLKIAGTFDEFQIYGDINLRETDLLVRGPGIAIKEINAEASFDGYDGKLKNFSALLDEGNIKADGLFKLRDKGFDINLYLEKTPITWDYVNATVDGDLSVKKDKQNILVEGDIALNRATITMQFKKQESKAGGRPSNLFLDLNFDATQGNVWVRNDMANIELAGKVGVNYEGGPLLVSGNLEVRQGMFYYLYKSFEVTEGEFNFHQSPEINPNINVKAFTLISSNSGERNDQDTVFLAVSGTMKTPEFDLYSKSSLSKAEIMTLLSLNLGWEDLTSVKSIEQSVTETAFNYWVRKTLNRRLKEEFGIDVLEMQGVSGHYEFVVGKYVTDKLFVKARTDVQSYGISEVQAEYKLKKWGYITAEKDFLGKTRFLFNFEWRY